MVNKYRVGTKFLFRGTDTETHKVAATGRIADSGNIEIELLEDVWVPIKGLSSSDGVVIRMLLFYKGDTLYTLPKLLIPFYSQLGRSLYG